MEIISHLVKQIKSCVPINLSEDQRSLNLHAIERFSRCHVASSPRASIAMRSDGFDRATSPVTRQNREVVDFTRSRVKNNSKLTNLMKIVRIEGIMVNKGRIHMEIRKFMMFSSKLIKSDDKSMVKIGENGIL